MFSKPQQALAKQISRLFQISLIQSQKETENKQANTVKDVIQMQIWTAIWKIQKMQYTKLLLHFTTLYMNAT